MHTHGIQIYVQANIHMHKTNVLKMKKFRVNDANNYVKYIVIKKVLGTASRQCNQIVSFTLETICQGAY